MGANYAKKVLWNWQQCCSWWESDCCVIEGCVFETTQLIVLNRIFVSHFDEIGQLTTWVSMLE
jgi:hypothetical protein